MNIIKKILFVSIFLIYLAGKSWSQQIPDNYQFFINKFSVSPAFAGFNGNAESFIGSYKSFIGISGAPASVFLNFNAPFSSNMGLGINIIDEKSGNFNNFYFDATYTFFSAFGNDFRFSLALTPRLYRTQFDLFNVRSYGYTIDPLLLADKPGGTAFNAGFSALLQFKMIQFSIGMPQIIPTKIKYNDSTFFSMSYYYKTHLSACIDINSDFYIEPLVVVNLTKNFNPDIYGGVFFKYKKKLWTSVGYKMSGILNFSVGGAVHDWLVINYSYNFGFSGLASYSGGTHELSVGFLIKRADNKTFSIFPESNTDLRKIEQKLNKIEQDYKQKDKKLSKRIDDLEKKINNQGNISNTNNNNTVNKTNTTVPKGITWEPSYPLNNVEFGAGGNRLYNSSYSELDKIVRKMKANQNLYIKITGYTSSLGSEKYNKDLTKRQAQMVADYLIKKGISANRIQVEGRGSENPIATNDTPEGREKNQRIEIAWGVIK